MADLTGNIEQGDHLEPPLIFKQSFLNKQIQRNELKGCYFQNNTVSAQLVSRSTLWTLSDLLEMQNNMEDERLHFKNLPNRVFILFLQ